MKITGWTGSKAATNEDGGVASLVTFLEKRASIHLGKLRGDKSASATIKKTRRDGDVLYISVPPNELQSFLRVNGYIFAGTNIKVEQVSVGETTPSDEPANSETTNQAKQLFHNFLSRRYDATNKLLDLSALGQDAELNAAGMFNSASTQSKFFPALMKICNTFFTSAEQKRETVHSVTLAGNELANLNAVTTLAQTFPDLLNLDLSNNNFESLSALTSWRHKFKSLKMLVMAPNPLEQKEPDFREKIKGWYLTLRFLDGVEIRSEEEAAQSKKRQKSGLPVQGPLFNDEANIATTFIQNFFAGFDSDRNALINMYYNDQSTFSYSLNNSALRDESQEKPQQHEWDAYIKQSRNLKLVSHLPARMNRQFKGSEAIQKMFSSLPTTRHAAYTSDPQKWCIECQPVPGVPDPTGASPSGVGGFLITIHGEYEEVAPNGGTDKKRSFDRTFVIGPGPDKPTGVVVVNDILVVRSYGGFAAWKPEEPAVPGVSTEEEKVLTVIQMTKMNAEFSKQALIENAWDVQGAINAFEAANAQGMIPPQAFTQ